MLGGQHGSYGDDTSNANFVEMGFNGQKTKNA
jgi:hypothetical protein